MFGWVPLKLTDDWSGLSKSRPAGIGGCAPVDFKLARARQDEIVAGGSEDFERDLRRLAIARERRAEIRADGGDDFPGHVCGDRSAASNPRWPGPGSSTMCRHGGRFQS